MIKKLLLLIALLPFFFVSGQNAEALKYFKKGEFKDAIKILTKDTADNSMNTIHIAISYSLECQQDSALFHIEKVKSDSSKAMYILTNPLLYN